MKILIIGGGISGLNTALNLLDNGYTDITIVEKLDRLGGKVHTLTKDSLTFECGAGRFSLSHIHLIGLLKRFNLYQKIVKIPSNATFSNLLDNNNIINIDTSELDNILLNISKLPLLEEYRNITLEALIIEKYGVLKSKLLIDYFGFKDNFTIQNAYDGILSLNSDFGKDYYILAGGLTQLVDRMADFLEKNGVKILLNTIICNKLKYLHFSNGSKLRAKYDKLVLAIDKYGLEKLKIKELEYWLDTVEISSLTRIYAKFPENSLPITNKTITNTPIGMIIPINSKLCMISYTDGSLSKYWHSLWITDRKLFNTTLMKYIRQIYPNITEPLWTLKLHWHNGCHLYRPLVNSNNVYNYMLNPLKNIYICGETFSHNHGWIEGALDTSEKVSQLILQNIRPYKIFKKDNLMDNYTIINGSVYDLTNWIENHPGGDIIKSILKKDGSKSYSMAGHSLHSKCLLTRFWIGVVEEDD